MTILTRFLAVFALLGASIAPLQAEQTNLSESLQLLNSAGKRGLLVQRMATCSCMTMLGDPNHRKMGEQAISAFEGSLMATSNPDLRQSNAVAHADMIEIWPDIRSALNQLLEGDHHSIVAHQLFEGTDELLERTQVIEDALLATSQNDQTDQQMALLRQMSDQRMLGKRMMKQACFMMAGMRNADHLIDLQQAIADYEKGFRAVLQSAAQDAEFEQTLQTVATAWAQFRTDLESVVSDESLGQEFASVMITRSDKLLASMSKAIAYLLQG